MITISAFKWVPDFARGQVRDLRARWALEEAGLPYQELLRNWHRVLASLGKLGGEVSKLPQSFDSG